MGNLCLFRKNNAVDLGRKVDFVLNLEALLTLIMKGLIWSSWAASTAWEPPLHGWGPEAHESSETQ